jgi:hypothetical protein
MLAVIHTLPGLRIGERGRPTAQSRTRLEQQNLSILTRKLDGCAQSRKASPHDDDTVCRHD